MRISTELPTETGTHVVLWTNRGHLFTAQLYKPADQPMQECRNRRIGALSEESWTPWNVREYDESITFTYLTLGYTIAPF